MGREVLRAGAAVGSGGAAADWGEENREQLVTTPLGGQWEPLDQEHSLNRHSANTILGNHLCYRLYRTSIADYYQLLMTHPT